MFCAVHAAQAQEHKHQWAISTNALSWVNLGTINAEGSMSVDNHFTVNAGFVANPWCIQTPTGYVDLMNKQYGGHLGAKYWPWHVYSEWWIGAKVQYRNFKDSISFETNKLKGSALEQGNALGAGLSAGYSCMINQHLNIDFGLGLWGGRMLTYKCGDDVGPRNFLTLDDIMVSLVYIF